MATSVKWNNGFVGSSTNEYGKIDVISPGNVSGTYRYTDIITVPKAGTTLSWTEPFASKVVSTNAYVVSSWKRSGSEWVLDKEGVNIPGSGLDSNGIISYDRSSKFITYTYVTQKDNEHLRLGCIAKENYAGGPTVYAGTSTVNNAGVYENLLWLPGFVGSERHGTAAARNSIYGQSNYGYAHSNLILIPKAGSTISYSFPVDGTNDTKVASANAYVFSVWERQPNHSFNFTYGMEGNDNNYTGANTAWQTVSGNTITYSYTSSYDNEYIRLCFSPHGNTTLPANMPTVTLTENSGGTPTLSVAYYDPANADYVRSVSWNNGYIGSDTNGQGNQNIVTTSDANYKHSNIFPVWGKGTLVMFTDRNSDFASASAYVFASFTGEDNAEKNVDTTSTNIRGNDTTHYTINPDGSRTYYYYTTKDVEYLRVSLQAKTGNLTNTSDANTFIPPAIYVLPSATLVTWHTGGYIMGNPDATWGDGMYSVNSNTSLMYSDFFTVPQAGTSIQVPAMANVSNNIALFSTYATAGDPTSGTKAIRPSAGSYITVGDTRLYTYTTTKDGEILRLCTSQNYIPVTGNYFLPVLVSTLGDHADIFDGKEMVIVGDSYFEGQYIGKQNVWPGLLAQIYGMTFYNHGINGSTISDYVTTNNPMVNRIDGMSGGATTDLVLFEGGRNDYNQKTPLGTLGDTDSKTFYGALHTATTKLLAKYPNALIVCLNPWDLTGVGSNNPNSAGHTSNDYAAAMRNYVASLDNDRVVMLNSNDTSVVPVFIKEASFRYLYSSHKNDISHMNIKGMKYALPYFEELLAGFMTKSNAVKASGGIQFEENGVVYRLLGSDVAGNRQVNAPMLSATGFVGWEGKINGGDAFYTAGSTLPIAVGDSGKLTPVYTQTGFAFASGTPTQKTYGDTAFTVSATGGQSGGAVTYAVVSGPATIHPTTGEVTITGAGTIVLEATRAAGNGYAAITARHTILVERLAITVTADNKEKIYGQADPTLTYTVSPELVNGDILTGELGYTGSAIGIYDIIEVVPFANDNYSITFVKGNITIHGLTQSGFAFASGTPTQKTYGDTAFTVSATGGQSGGAVTYAVVSGPATIHPTTGEVTITGAGTIVLEATRAAGNGYAAITARHTILVERLAITVTADDKEKTVGDADPVLTYTVSPSLVNGDTLEGELKYTGSAIGTYDIVAKTAFSNPNYKITFVKGKMTIKGKAQTGFDFASGTPAQKTYGDAAFTVTAVGGQSSGAITYAVVSGPATVNAATGEVTITGAGTVVLKATKAGDTEYAEAFAEHTLTVARLQITVTAENKDKFLGDADPALTYTVSPALVNGDTLTGQLGYTGTAPGVYDITEKVPFSHDNYIITFVKGSMTLKENPRITEASDLIESIPDEADTDFAQKVLEAAKATETLSEGEKAQLSTEEYNALKAAQDALAKQNHQKESMNVVGLPWHVTADVIAVDQADAAFAALGERLNGKKLQKAWSISFKDLLTNGSFSVAEDGVTVSYTPEGDLTGMKLILQLANGEIVEKDIANGETLEFNAENVTMFGLAEDASSPATVIIIVAVAVVACGAVAAGVVVFLKKKKKA